MAERTKTRAPAHETHIVCNRSDRRGPVLAVAVHSTESQDLPGTTDDLRSIRRWFNTPASQASSHIGVDGQGNTELWVHSNEKAWTIGAANGFTCNIEFVGRAAQAGSAWETAQIKAGARWLAYWALKYDLPIQQGNVRNINGLCVCTKKGVIRHSDVTAAGFGSHTDPGRNFPMDDFLRYGRYYRKNGWIV
jgi:N-acetyl-anhydromuramyl-L-alanine amidase AmpD